MPKRDLPTNRLAVAALILGIISLINLIIPFLNFFSIVMGPLGMILGFVSIRQIKRQPGEMKGSGLALTGLLLSLSATVLIVAFIALLFTMSTAP